MQGPSAGSGRLAKKPRLPDEECVTSILPTNMPLKIHSTDSTEGETLPEPNGEVSSQHPSETPTNAFAPSIPATSEPAIDESSDDRPNTAEALESSTANDLPIFPTHIQIEADEVVDNMSPTAHHAGYNILEDFFEHHSFGPETIGTEVPDKWRASTADSTHADTGLENTILLRGWMDRRP